MTESGLPLPGEEFINDLNRGPPFGLTLDFDISRVGLNRTLNRTLNRSVLRAAGTDKDVLEKEERLLLPQPL